MTTRKRKTAKPAGRAAARAASAHATNTNESSITLQQIIINPIGGLVRVEISFSPVRAQYQIFLYDQNGQNPEKVGEGLNFDAVPDFYIIQILPHALKGRVLFWQASMAGPDQVYAMRVNVTQDGNECGNSPFIKQGPLEAAKHDFDMAQFA